MINGNFILILLAILSNICLGQINLFQVNTTDPQASKNIQESKKDSLFIKEFIIDKSTDSTIILVVAWLEKGWFNDIVKRKVVKTPQKWCTLCFTLKQHENFKYSKTKYSSWRMKYLKNGRYVGYHGNVYTLTFNECDVPDIIRLDLIEVSDINSVVTRTKVGELIFKVDEKTLLKKE